MPTLYLRISPENMPYLDALAVASGTSKSQVTDLIITAARERGWSVVPGTPRITDSPGRDPEGISHE
jgi:hypothetical protein